MQNLLRIVSLQSTSRPGCIVELLPITEATQVSDVNSLLDVFSVLFDGYASLCLVIIVVELFVTIITCDSLKCILKRYCY